MIFTHTNTTPIIGLTGGIGSGKSMVSDWFGSQGIDVIDADIIAHQITTKDSPTLMALKDAFGDWVVDADGHYHRANMRQHLLDNPTDITRLNAITHPAINDAINDALAKSTSAYRILSVPLLVENRHSPKSLYQLCDRVLVVDVPVALQKQRATQRDAHKHANIHEYIDTIIAKQATRQERLSVACDVVDNSGDVAHLIGQLPALHRYYCSALLLR